MKTFKELSVYEKEIFLVLAMRRALNASSDSLSIMDVTLNKLKDRVRREMHHIGGSNVLDGIPLESHELDFRDWEENRLIIENDFSFTGFSTHQAYVAQCIRKRRREDALFQSYALIKDNLDDILKEVLNDLTEEELDDTAELLENTTEA